MGLRVNSLLLVFKMKKTVLFLTITLVIIVLIFLNGNKTEVAKQPLLYFDLYSAAQNDSTFYLSDFAKSIEYVKLDVSDSVYISDIREIDMTDEFIFILEKNFKLYKYDRNGNFIKRIGNNGEGPGEYIAPLSFALFPQKELIAVMDYTQQRIIIYSFSGKFIRQFKALSFSSKIANLNRKYIATITPFPEFAGNDNFGLTVYDFSGKTVSRMLNRGYETSKKGFDENTMPTEGRIFFRNIDDTLTYWEAELDTVYKIIDKNTIIPKVALINNRKNNSHRAGKIIENSLWIGKVTETKRYFFVTPCIFNNSIKHIILDKVTGKGYNMNINNINDKLEIEAGFINNVDGGWPVCPVRVTSGGEIVSFFYGFELKDIINELYLNKIDIKDSQKALQFKTIVNNAKIDDNPVLMIIKE